MPTRDRYDPARDIFTSNPSPKPPPAPPSPSPPPPAAADASAPLAPNQPTEHSQQQQPGLAPVPAPASAPAPARDSAHSSPRPASAPVPHPQAGPVVPPAAPHASPQAVPRAESLPSRKRRASSSPSRPASTRPSPSSDPRAAHPLPRRAVAQHQQHQQPAEQPQQDDPPSRAKRRRLPDGDPSSSAQHYHAPQRRRRDGERDREPRYRFHSPPPPLIPPAPQHQDPTPPPSRQPSPPRQRKRPGAASRLNAQEKALLQQSLLQSDEADKAAGLAASAPERVDEVVRSHYNDKKELGKEWRQTSSKIRGLRAFNNWVKSTLIHKFSPSDGFDPRRPPSRDPNDLLVVLDMGCGKGGDLLKWKSAPQEVGFYCGVDSADVSIAHARERYDTMRRDPGRGRGRGGGGGGARSLFTAEFHAMDCWTKSVASIPIVQRIGHDASVGPSSHGPGPGTGGGRASRFGSTGGFDVVSMMFCMHYAFETEQKCRTMLRNVAGSLKPGGRFIGTIPSSDGIAARVRGAATTAAPAAAAATAATAATSADAATATTSADAATATTSADAADAAPPPGAEHGVQEWGNSIYRIRFARPPPRSATFRPPFGWQYNFFLEEAVEEVPEYVVPWEAFRGLAEDYGLELEYKRLFHDVWREEKDQPELRQLSERMGVRRNGHFSLGPDEWEACGIYLAFAFRKG